MLYVTPSYPLGLCPIHIGLGADKCDQACLPNRLAWPPLIRELEARWRVPRYAYLRK